MVTRGRYKFLVGFGIFIGIVISSFLIISLFFTTVRLHVYANSCADNQTQNHCPGINLTDAQLSQSPKLQEVIMKTDASVIDASGFRQHWENITLADFDQINKVLVNTDDPEVMNYAAYGATKEQVKENPGLIWPRFAWIVTVSHGGNAYQLSRFYEPYPPPWTPWE